LLPPVPAFLSKAWQRLMLSCLVSSRENLLRNCGSVLLKYAVFMIGLYSLQVHIASKSFCPEGLQKSVLSALISSREALLWNCRSALLSYAASIRGFYFMQAQTTLAGNNVEYSPSLLCCTSLKIKAWHVI